MDVVKDIWLNTYRIGYNCESIDSTLLHIVYREHTCLATWLADAFKVNSENIIPSSIVQGVL